MAEYPSIVLTNAGLDMIAESQAGQNLIFTKLKIGDGSLGTGESIAALTGLKSFKLDVPIQGFLNQGNGQVRLRYLVDNSGVEANKGFFMREVGVYAKVTESGTEKLYAYTNGGNRVDWIPDLNTPMDAQIFDVFVLIGNASNVTININSSATYATKLDVTEHNESPSSHAGLFLPIPGGTLTGPLTLAADPTEPKQAATKDYADNNGGVNLRKNSHTYTAGNICYSKTAESYKYMQCLVTGTTAATEPTSWPDVGQTIQDGTVTWVVRDIRAGEQVGSIKPWLANAAPPGWLALDTGALVSRTTYPQLWAWVQAYAPLVSETVWQAQAAVQTSVGAYSSGDGSTTFRLPKIVDFVRGSDGTRTPGAWQADALQNITGTFATSAIANITGAFSQGTIYSGNGRDSQPNAIISLDASRVARTADETRPKSVTMLYCVKAWDAPVNQGTIDITALANTVAALSTDVKVVAYQGGTNGYIKYSNGHMEQWAQVLGVSLAKGGIYDVPFPTLFVVACDNVSVTYMTANPDDGMNAPQAINYAPNKFQIKVIDANSALTDFSYRAIGRWK